MKNCLNYKVLTARSAAMALGLVLAACSGGGGGGVATNPPNPPAPGGNSPGGNTGGGTSPPTPLGITAPGAGTFGGNAPNIAAGTTGFAPPGPAAGTTLTFRQSAVKSTASYAVDANAGGGTFTITANLGNGTNLIGELSIPGLSLTIPNTSINPNGGTGGGQPNGGGAFSRDHGALNYTLLGVWDYRPIDPAIRYTGYSLGGFQTPSAGLPTSGTATYTGVTPPPPGGGVGGVAATAGATGGAVGSLFVPSQTGGVEIPRRIAGDATIAVNFASGTVSGSLTNMTITGGGQWNNVSLTGSLSGATLSGTASTNAAPASAGRYGFPANATGRFDGALYGPNAEEIGAIWSVHDPSGMSVLGGFTAKK